MFSAQREVCKPRQPKSQEKSATQAAKRKKPVKLSTVAVEEARKKREDDAQRRKREELEKEMERKQALEAAEEQRKAEIGAAQEAIADAKATLAAFVSSAAADDDEAARQTRNNPSGSSRVDGPANRRSESPKASSSPRPRDATSRSLDSCGLARSPSPSANVPRGVDEEAARQPRDLNNGIPEAQPRSSNNDFLWPRGVRATAAPAPVAAPSALKTISTGRANRTMTWASAVAGDACASDEAASHKDQAKQDSDEQTKPESWAAAARGKQAVENAWQSKPKGALARGFAGLRRDKDAPAPAVLEAPAPAEPHAEAPEPPSFPADAGNEAEGADHDDGPHEGGEPDGGESPPQRTVWGGKLPAALRAPPASTKVVQGPPDAAKAEAETSEDCTDDEPGGRPESKETASSGDGTFDTLGKLLERPEAEKATPDEGVGSMDDSREQPKGCQHQNHHPVRGAVARERGSRAGSPKTQQYDQHRRSREEAEGAAYQARRASVGRQTEEERRRRIDESSNLDSEAAADRVARCAWKAAQLEESQERRVLERRRSAGVMRKRLACDVDDFVRRLDAAMEPQRLARGAVLVNVTDVVKSIWAHAECSLYGSCLTMLDLPSSDVDVVVRGLGGDPTPNPPQTLPPPPRRGAGQHSSTPTVSSLAASTAARPPYIDRADGTATPPPFSASPTAVSQRQARPGLAAQSPQAMPTAQHSSSPVSNSSRFGGPRGPTGSQQPSALHAKPQLPPNPAEGVVMSHAAVDQHVEAQHPPLPRGSRRRKLESEPSDYSFQMAASSRDSNDSDYVAYDDYDEYEDIESSNNDDMASAFGDAWSTGKQPHAVDSGHRSYVAPSMGVAPPPLSTSSDNGYVEDDDRSDKVPHKQPHSTATVPAAPASDGFDDTASDQPTYDETASIASSERALRRGSKPHDLRGSTAMSSHGRRDGTDDEDDEAQRAMNTSLLNQQAALAAGMPIRTGHQAFVQGAVATAPQHAIAPGVLPHQAGGVDLGPPFSRHVQSHLAYTARVPHRAATPTRVESLPGLQRQPYLRCPTPPAAAPAGVVTCLKMLAAALASRPWVRELKAIETTSIPVIKLLADPALLDPPAPLPSFRRSRCEPGGEVGGELNEEDGTPVWNGAIGRCDSGLLAVDISFEAPNHGGLASSQYASETMNRWPETMPLMLVLKELLAQNRLNEPFTGGLSSYSLLLLVITAMLQAGVVRCRRPDFVFRGAHITLPNRRRRWTRRRSFPATGNHSPANPLRAEYVTERQSASTKTTTTTRWATCSRSSSTSLADSSTRLPRRCQCCVGTGASSSFSTHRTKMVSTLPRLLKILWRYRGMWPVRASPLLRSSTFSATVCHSLKSRARPMHCRMRRFCRLCCSTDPLLRAPIGTL